MGFKSLKARMKTTEEAAYFLPLSSQKLLVLIFLLTSDYWRANNTNTEISSKERSISIGRS